MQLTQAQLTQVVADAVALVLAQNNPEPTGKVKTTRKGKAKTREATPTKTPPKGSSKRAKAKRSPKENYWKSRLSEGVTAKAVNTAKLYPAHIQDDEPKAQLRLGLAVLEQCDIEAELRVFKTLTGRKATLKDAKAGAKFLEEKWCKIWKRNEAKWSQVTINAASLKK